MRLLLIGLFLVTAIEAPGLAQSTVERRVDRLEQELRAVQRRVFPQGGAQVVEPEFGAPAPGAPAGPAPTGTALSSLTARVDALERQLATLTGQAEENGWRLRQVEEAMNALREETNQRLAAAERAAAPPAPVQAPPFSAPTPPAAAGDAAPVASTGDPAQDAYNAGYRLWDQRRYAEAQAALEAAAEQYPNSRWASWARNLAGRAYLDDGKPATAARILLANYQDLPRGERAADSLFFLGTALVQLDRHAEACRVYDELAEVYPTMRDWLRQRLPDARRAARCG